MSNSKNKVFLLLIGVVLIFCVFFAMIQIKKMQDRQFTKEKSKEVLKTLIDNHGPKTFGDTNRLSISNKDFLKVLTGLGVTINKKIIPINGATKISSFRDKPDPNHPIIFLNEAHADFKVETFTTLDFGFYSFVKRIYGITRNLGDNQDSWYNLKDTEGNKIQKDHKTKPGDIGISECPNYQNKEVGVAYVVHGILLNHREMSEIKNADYFLEFTTKFYKSIMDLAKKKNASTIILVFLCSDKYEGDGEFGDETKFTKNAFIDAYKLGMLKALESDDYAEIKKILNSKLR